MQHIFFIIKQKGNKSFSVGYMCLFSFIFLFRVVRHSIVVDPPGGIVEI